MSEFSKAWAASLWAGPEAWLSHHIAARLWRLDDSPCDLIDISAPRHLITRVSWVRPRRCAALLKEMRRHPGGLPVTSPPRTLVDLAGVVDEELLERATELAFRRKLVSIPELSRVLTLMPKRGRTGTKALC
jgi:hypothetical protein